MENQSTGGKGPQRTTVLLMKLLLLLPSESACTLRTRKPFLYSSAPVAAEAEAEAWCAASSDRGFPLLPTRFTEVEAVESQRLSPSSENDLRSSSSSLGGRERRERERERERERRVSGHRRRRPRRRYPHRRRRHHPH